MRYNKKNKKYLSNKPMSTNVIGVFKMWKMGMKMCVLFR